MQIIAYSMKVKNYVGKDFKKYLDKAAKEVLKSIPYPFGSLEKAKYEIFNHVGRNGPVYRFTTTIHNQEEAIRILRGKLGHHMGIFTSFKTVNGVREKIDSGYLFDIIEQEEMRKFERVNN